MFSTDITKTIEACKERLESHEIMVDKRSADRRHRGMEAPAITNNQLPNDLLSAFSRLLDKNLSGYQRIPRGNGGHHRNDGNNNSNDGTNGGGDNNNRRRGGRAKRGKWKGRDDSGS